MASNSNTTCRIGTSSWFQVGSIVRAPRGEGEKPNGRAMIATIQDDQSVCLLWEPYTPKPLHDDDSSKFLVAPSITVNSLSQEEITMDHRRIQPLLDFELGVDTPPTEMEKNATVNFWKDRGDQLLRLGDPSSAIPYYEMALKTSSVVSIGSSVICSIQGYPKVAEVDCVEENTVDVVYVESGEEATIVPSDIRIAILDDDDDDDEDRLQERVLLNLARCLLQHSDIDTPHRSKFLKSAVLACTLVLSLSSFHNASVDQNNIKSENMSQTALLLRVKAQVGLSKWPHASADAKRLVQLGSLHGHKLLESIEREKKHQAQRDKKLVKAVSRWVQTATSELVSEPETIGKEGTSVVASTDASGTEQAQHPTTNRMSTQPSFPFSSPLVCLLALVAAFLIQKIIT